MKKFSFSWLKKGSVWFLILILVGVEIWLIKDIFSLINEIKNLRLQTQSTINFFESLASLQKEKKEAEKYFSRIYQLLPEEKDVFNLLNDLEERARLRDLEAQFQIGDIKKEKNLKSVEIEFALKGEFERVINFFKSLENAPYFISIQIPKTNFLEGEGLYFFAGKAKIFIRNVQKNL
ncbi:type 4a pilus biogenesis protein PilO [bacterium]|nr:type 4a pilus biogenesis protein PilO [bacterium]